MIKELILKWGLRNSEKEVVSFLNVFSQCDPEQSGAVVGMAALLHHQHVEKEPEFQTILNSPKGANHGPINMYVMKLNWLVGDFKKAGRRNAGAAMKLWNITFRCMSHETLHHYGVALWKTASASFPYAKQWLEVQLEVAESAANERDAVNLRAALKLYDFVPLQFAGS